MPKFSEKSLSKLKTCNEQIQILMLHVVTHYDCTIVDGHRNKETQDSYFADKKSKVKWPNSKHNSTPSLAVDVAPYIADKISWDTKQCYNFAGFVMGCASMMGMNLRWGGDWDQDEDIYDQTFNDLVHFELLI